MPNLSVSIRELLYDESHRVANEIIESVIANGQSASGRTISQIRPESTDTELAIYAPDYFPTLETGISPAMAMGVNISFLKRRIYGWSVDKGISFIDKKARWWFSTNTATSMQEVGSKLFRSGGRRDVYSDKVEPLIQRLSERISRSLIEYKIIQ